MVANPVRDSRHFKQILNSSLTDSSLLPPRWQAALSVCVIRTITIMIFGDAVSLSSLLSLPQI